MRPPPSLLILCVLLAAATATATEPDVDLVGDHDRAERGRLQGWQIRAAEQLERMNLEPANPVEAPKSAPNEVELVLLHQLRTAKQMGDLVMIRGLEEELAALRNEPVQELTPSPLEGDDIAVVFHDEAREDGDRWLPHEFLLAGTEWAETRPTMASDAAGTLYAALEQATTGGHYCVLYRSTDRGEHWDRVFTITGTDLRLPSLAVGQGNENWLLMAFHNASSDRIHVFRWSLDNPSLYDLTEIESNPIGVASPRIATDADEFAGWYAYLVFNSCGVDNWVLRHTRTTNYGDTWTVPQSIDGYCGYPGVFYEASEAHADIEFGSDRLYVAFDNYPSPCVTDSRDIYILASTNYGGSWSSRLQLTTHEDDEHDPALAAVKGYLTNRTIVVAYTRFYHELDDDVWFRYTQNGGSSWSLALCIACTVVEERNVNLATSPDLGSIHATFWDELNIDYAVADYGSPSAWTREDSISTTDTASDIGTRPGLLVDQSMPAGDEAGIAWTDFRNETATDLDVYYDARALPHPPPDYYLYAMFNPGLEGYLTGIDGYVDVEGAIEGIPGAQYVFFESGASYEGDHTAYVYRVETDGDPETHPDNPLNPGPIATRTFTLVSSNYLGYFASGHDNAFYVDETGVYYGASPGWAAVHGCGVFHWDFHWNPLEPAVPLAAPGGTQTLARNATTGEWWVGTGNRRLFKWDGGAWAHQFTYPGLGGGHHDGLEIINNSIVISDMTSDVTIQYRLDDSGIPIDPPTEPLNTFFYSATPAVEGMGHEPNNHIWMAGYGSRVIYEIGGGALQTALNGIPDQCVTPGMPFEPFDLDDFVVGAPPFTWSWEGNVDLTVTKDSQNVVTVNYPAGWIGQETITFTVLDGLGRYASDAAVFTVSGPPTVGDIPDQTAPFEPFDLDEFLAGANEELVSWTASGMSCLEVGIDPVSHVATVTIPDGCYEPEVITFTARILPCGTEFSDGDAAVFDPGTSGVADIAPGTFGIGPAIPNPAAPRPDGPITRLSYTIPTETVGRSGVALTVHDVRGRLVRTLVGAEEPFGGTVVTWDGRDDTGVPVPAGAYFFQLTWGGKHASTRVILLR